MNPTVLSFFITLVVLIFTIMVWWTGLNITVRVIERRMKRAQAKEGNELQFLRERVRELEAEKAS